MTTDFKIDKTVPAPRDAGRPNRKYPLDKLQIGDSFFVPAEEVNSIDSVVQSALRYGRRHGVKFTTRKVTEKGKDGVRVWRIENWK
jgi:hypothetical protein